MALNLNQWVNYAKTKLESAVGRSNEELDRLVTDAAERTASVTNKASFLAVSAGVLVAASTVQLWVKAPTFGVVALAHRLPRMVIHGDDLRAVAHAYFMLRRPHATKLPPNPHFVAQ